MKSTMSLLLLALAASGASAADDIYRSVMPDGSIRYGESAAPGAKSVRKVAPPPISTGVTIVTPAEQARPVERTERGAVAVIPPAPRPPIPPADQGLIQSPQGLPGRAY
jgi:hypothetical protein